jgi:hypothetical protein
MQLNFAVLLAMGSLCVSLVAFWQSWRTHKRLTTIKKFEAERDLKLKKIYRERVKKEYPSQVSKVKEDFASRGLSSSRLCKKTLDNLKTEHDRDLAMLNAEIEYLEQVVHS